MARKNVRKPAERKFARQFLPHDEQQQASHDLVHKLRLKRLKKNGASEADVIAHTAARLRRYPPGSTTTKAYD